MLHGVVSHSEWLDPVARRLAERGIQVICPDRRGSGRCDVDRGDLPSRTAVLADLDLIVRHYGRATARLDLAGFCWGATYAVDYLSTYRPAIASLALLAPAIFPSRKVAGVPLEIGDATEATLEPNIPLEAFTQGPLYRRFILPDPYRLRKVSPRLNGVIQEMSRFIGAKLVKLQLPILVVLAAEDIVTDNEATETAFHRMRARPKRLTTVAGHHGVQFDAPGEVAAEVGTWIEGNDAD